MATLCFTPYLDKRFSKGLLQKCEPPSLIMALGTPNLEKMFSFRNFSTTDELKSHLFLVHFSI